MSRSDDTEKAAQALESAAAQYGRHSGPESTHDERAAFSRDLRTAAVRYARAYYAEARSLELVPGHDAESEEASP